MSEALYNKQLRKILSDKSKPLPTALSKAEIEARIAAISEELKGPLKNWDRLEIEAREVLRKQLATAEARE